MAFGSNSRESKFSIAAFVNNAMKGGKEITQLPIDRLRPYNNGHQPFRMYISEEKEKMKESIRTSGLLQPILVREMTDEPDCYEILAGHNRTIACKELGMTEIDGIVLRGISDAQAKLIVTDSNLVQRNEQLPSDRAAAYFMQQQALKELGVRNTVEAVSEQYGESRKTISRYLALNNLHNELKESVDEGHIHINAGAILSTIPEDGQEALADYIYKNPKTKITEAAAVKLKNMFDEGNGNAAEIIEKTFFKKKAAAKVSIKLTEEALSMFELEIPHQKLEDFLVFCLQHKVWQQEFVDALNGESEEDCEVEM